MSCNVFWFAYLFVYDLCMCVFLFTSYLVSIIIYFDNLYIEFCFLLQEEEMFHVMNHISREIHLNATSFKPIYSHEDIN
jgi:hypothetical protein